MLRLQGSLPDNKLDSKHSKAQAHSCIMLKGPQGPRRGAAHTIKLQTTAADSPDCFNNTKPCTYL